MSIKIQNNFTLIPVAQRGPETFIKHYIKWANDESVTKYLFQGTFPVCNDDAAGIYKAYVNSSNVVFYIMHNRLHYGIRYTTPIGVVGIHDIHWPSRIGEFRIFIGDPEFWGKGLGKNCLNIMVGLAFDKYNLYKFWLGYNSEHTRAAKAYSKSGFKQECVIPQAHYRNGMYTDAVRMAIFKDEYNARKDSNEV